MASNVSARIRKKEYNSSTDNIEGVIVFDTITKTVLVGGERFGSSVKSATYNNVNKTLQITDINGSVISLNFADDTSANEPNSLLSNLRDSINQNSVSIATITGTGDGSITKEINDAMLDNKKAEFIKQINNEAENSFEIPEDIQSVINIYRRKCL